MKNVCVWLVSLAMMTFAARYAYQTWKHEISPALSTWIIFFLGTALSLTTYAIAEEYDFRSGILNTIDVAAMMIALITVLLWGRRDVRFKRFEKWYLGGIALIIAYGVLSRDAWGSNLFTQVLISLGFFPTMQNLLVEKRNTESFTGWGCGILAGLLALYPAMTDGNLLATLYAIRSTVLVASIISLMAYYELKK